MLDIDLYHGFRVGTFHCLSVSDGYYDYPLPLMFGGVPVDDVQGALRSHGWPDSHVISPYACLFVDTGRHRVLIDVGAGGLAPTTGFLHQNLQAAGIDPASIDVIILTHLHPGHIGGNLAADGTPHFPSATVYISRREWDFWWSPASFAESKLPSRLITFIRQQAKPLAHDVELFDGNEEIVTGIQVVPAAGHTPGHAAVAISSEGADLLHVADAACHPLHLEYPDWGTDTDVDPAAAVATRRRLFDQAEKQNLLLFTHHFGPPPNTGRVRRHGRGWEWIPETPWER